MSIPAFSDPEQGRGPYVAPSFLFIDQPWADQALCAQTDPEAFFPEKGGSTRVAKATCAKCFVQAECLDWALSTNERFGIWGGLSERERRALQKHTDTERTAS
jgi:WhiB family redox-sensing transcriptional regulator